MQAFIRNHSYLLLLLITAVACYIYTFDAKIHLGGDNAEYYQLAQGFAEFKGYVSMMVSDEPPAKHFPPGYPFILSLPMMVGISGITSLKILNGLFFLICITLVFKIGKELGLSDIVSFSASFLTIINVHILNYSFILMSEIPYTFFALVSIWGFLKYQNSSSERLKDKGKWLAITLLCAVASYYIRSIGIAISITLILVFTFKKSWKELAIVLGANVLLIGPWMLRMRALAGGSYSSQLMKINPYRPELGTMDTLGNWLNRISANIERYLGKEFSAALINPIDWSQTAEITFGMTLSGVAILLIGFYGIYLIRTQYRVYILLFMMGHFGILLLWPDVWFGTRFMLSLVPLMYLLIVIVVSEIGSKFLSGKKAYRTSIVFLGVFTIYSMSGLKQLNGLARSPNNPRYIEYFDLAKAAATQLPENAIVSCRKPAFFFMYSGKKVTGYAFSEDQSYVLDQFRSQGVTHVVVDNLGFSSTPRYLIPVIQQNPQHFKLIAQKKGANTYLFEFLP